MKAKQRERAYLCDGSWRELTVRQCDRLRCELRHSGYKIVVADTAFLGRGKKLACHALATAIQDHIREKGSHNKDTIREERREKELNAPKQLAASGFRRRAVKEVMCKQRRQQWAVHTDACYDGQKHRKQRGSDSKRDHYQATEVTCKGSTVRAPRVHRHDP